MFTGLISETGRVVSAAGGGGRLKVRIEAPRTAPDLLPGDSIAVDGVCQTVTEISGATFSVDVMEATLMKTTLCFIKSGTIVNLEKAITPASPMGGHFVQGHVSGTGIIRSIDEKNSNIWLSLTAGDEVTDYCIPEGSIAIDGISLTIARIKGELIFINIIPETWKRTSLRNKRKESIVNIETDMIGRYIHSFLSKSVRTLSSGNNSYQADSIREKSPATGLTFSDLKKWGY